MVKTISLSPTLESNLIDLLTVGADRTAVVLEDTLALAHQTQDPVSYSHRSLEPHRNYWLKTSRVPSFLLYQQLSEDLIEVPYIDDPVDYLYLFEKVAFHVNHGTPHAVHQVELVRHYHQLVKLNGTPESAKIAASFSKEEYACLELAAFLFRSGRTNECPWRDDPTFGKRSAAIFKHVALGLGYTPALVDLIAQCFDYHAPITVVKHLPHKTLEETQGFASLCSKLLKLTHESDLVRCHNDYETIKAPIVEEMTHLLASGLTISDIADQFLDYAITLCKETGLSVRLTDRVTVGEKKNLIIETTHKIPTCFGKLSLITPAPLRLIPPASPTALWLSDTRHRYVDTSDVPHIRAYDVLGQETVIADEWTVEQMAAIPTKKCVDAEEAYVDTHVSVYHATTRTSYILDLLCRHLSALRDKPDTVWVRPIHSKPPKGVLYSTIDKMKEVMSLGLSRQVDNSAQNSWHLLSCSPSLWQNADFDAQESTVHFFYNNCSINELLFKEIFFTLLDNLELAVEQPEIREKMFEEFLAIATSAEFGKQGALYQFLIPLDLVDEVAFISRKNGIYDPENPSALETLQKLKVADSEVTNRDTLQVRLFVPQLLNQSVMSRIIVSNHLNCTPEVVEKLAARVLHLAQQLISAPTVRKEVSASADSRDLVPTGARFSLLDGLKDRRPLLSDYVAPKSVTEEESAKKKDEDEFDPFSFLSPS